MTAGFDLRFDVTGPSADGTWLALCQELPMIISAASETDLRQRIVIAVNELTERLEALGDRERLTFLNEAGVKLQSTDGEAATRTITLPVSVGAAAR
ncbi:MAG TPA: hypothetical protein PKD27_13200 [Tepidiformaceae bacterium]|nr:hypothetical protein [Tepidiformaceae bacterium]